MTFPHVWKMVWALRTFYKPYLKVKQFKTSLHFTVYLSPPLEICERQRFPDSMADHTTKFKFMIGQTVCSRYVVWS